MNSAKPNSSTTESTCQAEHTHFLAYVVLAYATQGIAQHFCLIAQPLEYYLLKSLAMDAAAVAALLSVLMLPFIIKPIFGVLSDAFPLAGYRRKSYLCLLHGLSGMFYIAAAFCQSLELLFCALFFTALGMAAGTVILCGLTLEVGRPEAQTRKFQSIQAVAYYCANIFSFLLGGYLCAHLEPQKAISAASLIAAVPCFVTAAFTWRLVEEERLERQRISWPKFKEKLKQTKMHGLAYVCLFICCWSFSPGYGTPLYFHQTKDLHFNQQFIGQLGAILSLGMISGSLFYRHFLDKKLSPQGQAKVAVAIGTVSTFAYLLLGSEASAVALELLRGFAEIIAILLAYGLAADVSPKDFESTTIALLIAASNIAKQLSINIGAVLYTYVFKNSFTELIIVSALSTLACWLLIPLLPQKDQYLETD